MDLITTNELCKKYGKNNIKYKRIALIIQGKFGYSGVVYLRYQI